MNYELPDVQAGFGNAEEPEIKLPASTGSLKNQENTRKTSTSASLTTLKPLTVWITANCGKFFKRWEYQTILPASWEICIEVKKQQLELDMEQLTCSKLGKEYVKAVYCHPYLFNLYAGYIMGNTRLDESQAGIKIAPRNINNLRNADHTTLMADSEEELKSILMKMKEESEKAGLKFNTQKWRSWHPVSSLHGK